MAAGDPIKQGSAVWTAMAERRRVVMRVDKALWGKTCIAVAVPIVAGDNEIVGAASVQETVDRQEELKEMANKLTDSLSTLASTSQEISAVAQATADTMRASETRVSEMGSILSLIDNIARQTNLLGLSAAIEAARAGESGRGFGVVADEIRKLAAGSSGSVRRIEDAIRAVQEDSRNANAKMEQINATVSQVSAAIVLVATAAHEVSELAAKLDGMANSLSETGET